MNKKKIVNFNPNSYKMNLKEDYKNIVSYSGGKDSTAIILLLREKEIVIDDIVFFDTGWEFPEIYKHNKELEKIINQKITVLKPEKSFEWWMYEKPCNNPFTNGKGKGWPRFNLRWCTGLKNTTIRRYIRTKYSSNEYHNFIGICYDEDYRLQRKPKSHFNIYKYPLIEYKIIEKESKKICFDYGFNFSGLYDYMNSVSCWCCPLQPLRALRNLYRYFPDLWEKLMEMGKKTQTPFKIGKNVRDGIFLEQLEKRFIEECKQQLITKWF